MPGTLICYGDSNTYGYDPHDTNEGRYPKEEMCIRDRTLDKGASASSPLTGFLHD